MRPQVGQVINNKYRLLRLIGDGGMGSVYESRHEVLGTSVALKFLHSELTKRDGLVARFLQEARVSAQIQSPHVVRVTDVDQTAGGAYIVMEYIEGKTLQTLYEDLYKAGQQLSYPDALEYAMQMLEGVEAAHTTGIVHRDLKPDNVMITVDGKGRPLLKLLDFGIAKLKVSGEYDRGLTRPGVIMGTPEYMAPEQAYSADAVDARADIFSLGVMIFEMLAGRRPVGGDDPHQIATAYLSGQVARLTDLAPDLAPDLAAAVHHAMAPLPRDRWPSVSAFRDAIEPFAAAARAPSALPSTSLPGVSRVSMPGGYERSSGATNAAALSGQRKVPKTLPPDDGGHDPETTSPDAPPAMSGAGHPGRGPTPLGGFVPFAEGAVSQPASGPAFIPPTRSVAPLSAGRGRDPGATASAAPFAPTDLAAFGGSAAIGARAPSAAYSVTPRPSGTAIGDAFPAKLGGSGGAGTMPAPMPAFAPVAPLSLGGPKLLATTPRRGGVFSSLPAILLLAAAVSAAVVGGVYLAHSRAKSDDHEDPPVVPPAPTSVSSDPPPDDEPPGSAAPVPSTPQHPLRPTQPGQPSQPGHPPPHGSAGPVAPPPSSSAPPPQRVPILPSSLPPFIIPTSLPFNFPLLGGPPDPPRPQDPGNRPPRRPRPADGPP